MNKTKFLGSFALFGMLSMSTASAALIITSLTPNSGTGLGTVNTELTIQNSPSETGCVAFGGTTGATMTATGTCTGSAADVKTGASQTQTRTLAQAGIGTGATGAAGFAIVFNAVQPGNATSISLDALTASFYSPTGTLLFESSGLQCGPAATSGGSCLLPNTLNGAGQSGYVIQLNAAQQAAAVTAGAFSSTSNVVGLSGAAGGAGTVGGVDYSARGGFETFYLGSTTGPTPIGGQVPEPATYAMFASGLCLVGFARKFLRG